MRHQDFQILCGINIGVFRRAAEKEIRMFDNVLIERSAGSHQHGRRSSSAAFRRDPARCQLDAMVPG